MSDEHSWRRIRPVAMGAIRRDDELFVTREEDPVTGDPFYRLPGGGIHFGELAADAAVRELEEEFDLTLCDPVHVGTLEDVFTFDGETRHEHWWIFQGTFEESWPYEREAVEGYEPALDVPLLAEWVSIERLQSSETTFYDERILGMLVE